MVKKSIKLGIAAFAVVAIALGIGIGVGQKNSQKASSSNLSEVSNVYAAYDMDCVKARRELVVPGTEEYHGSPTKRRMLFRKKVSKISNRQTRKLGKENVPAVFNDEGFIKPEEIEDYGSGSSSSSGSGKSGKSGGFRVIYYLKKETAIYIISVYSKSERSNISTQEIIDILGGDGLV